MREFGPEVSAEDGEPFGVVLEPFDGERADAGHFVVLLDVGFGNKGEGVLISGQRPAYRGQVIELLRAFGVYARDVELAAQNGLNPGFFGFIDEIDTSVHDAVIGHGHGFDLSFGDFGTKLGQPNGTVVDAVLRMDVEVDESAHGCVVSPSFCSMMAF